MRITRTHTTTTVRHLIGLPLLLVPLATPLAAPPVEWAAGRILVAPRAGLPEQALEKILENASARAIAQIGDLPVRIVEVPPGQEVATVKRLVNNPHVAFAEVDRAVELSAIVPNDPKYSSAWHLAKLGMSTAWELSNGTGVTVAVIDSGVDKAHTDLGANVLSGWNVVSQNTDSADVNGHGTAVAGTIAALTNNGNGVASIAFGAKILPVRVTNASDGYTYWSDIASGISWAAANGARIANISYDITGSSAITTAAQAMRQQGGIVVVSAGNNNVNPGYAVNPYLITVAATNSSDTRTTWSNFGDYVDFAAPGQDIWTTSKGGTTGMWWGTSFSAPVVAGVVAQILGTNPLLSPSQVESILQQTSVDLGTAGPDPYYGFGRVNPTAAITMAQQSSPADSQPPTAVITTPAAGTTVAGLTGVTVQATDNYGVAQVELYANNVLVGTDSTEPFAFSWDPATARATQAALIARAVDEAGNRTDSATVNVTIAADAVPPVVTLSSPVNGTVVSGGASVTINASARDDVAMAQLTVLVNGKLLCSGTSSVSCAWSTRRLTVDSSHTITATGTDAAGNKASVSATVKIGGTTTTTTPKRK